MKRFVPLSIPNFNGNEKKYVDDALEQGWVSTGGAYITRLEQQLAEFLKVDRAAACRVAHPDCTLHLWSAVCSRETW